MTQSFKHVRHGIGSVRPYVYGHLPLWDLVRDAFSAVEIERHEFGPKSFHIEAQIGDSVIVLETGDPPDPEGTAGSIYVYVEDVDFAYHRALDGEPDRLRSRSTSRIRNDKPEFVTPSVTSGGSRLTAAEPCHRLTMRWSKRVKDRVPVLITQQRVAQRER